MPKDAGSLWATYDVHAGPLSGFEIGGGLYAASDRKAALNSTFRMDSYAVFNALLSYTTHGWKAAVNVTNLFDKRYYQSATGLSNVFFGEPRVATFRIQKTF